MISSGLQPDRSLSDLGRRQAKIGPSEDSFCRICRPIAPLWVKKTVKNGPLRSICSRRLPSPTGSYVAVFK